jgi:hypothetical protein
VADILGINQSLLAAEAGIPVTILMGQGSEGLGRTGKEDRATWEHSLRAWWETHVAPQLRWLCKLIFLSKQGPTTGVEPDSWDLVLGPMSEPSAMEVADTRHKHAEADKLHAEIGALLPEEVGAVYEGDPSENGGRRANLELRQALRGGGVVGAAPAETGLEQAEGGAGLEGLGQGGVSAKDASLNGAQAQAFAEVLGAVDVTLAPGAVARMLTTSFALSPAEAAALVEEQRQWRAARPNAPTPSRVVAPPRTDSAPMLRVERADAHATNFPAAGSNLPVSLQHSAYGVFDPAWAEQLREDYPELWACAAREAGERQYARLSRLAAQGGPAQGALEDYAVRYREAWAARHHGDTTLVGVVAQVKHRVVGVLGEEGMKRVLTAAKDKMQRKRARLASLAAKAAAAP